MSVVVGLLLLMLLSGCMTVQSNTTIANDGSGTNQMSVGFTKEFIEFMQQMDENAEDPFADIEQDMDDVPPEWDATVEPWEDDTYKGVSISTKFTDLAMLETQLNKLLGPDSDEEGDSMFEEFTVTQEGNTVIITTRMVAEGVDESQDLPFSVDDFKVTWSVAMPTLESYTEEDIATQDGDRVTWTFPLAVARTYNIEVRGTLEGTAPVEQPTEQPTEQPSAELPGERCFDEVPDCISGRIRQYWEQNGGLTVFGYPIAPQQEEMIEGEPYQVQWFERNRLELHPENERPYDVLLGRLGIDMLEQQGRDWNDFEQSEAQEGCVYFEQTGHNICGEFLEAWRANGLETDGTPGLSQQENLALFGLPVSDQMTETLEDGNEYTVQYFERARFELHPENDPPYNVLFGLLGKQIRQP